MNKITINIPQEGITLKDLRNKEKEGTLTDSEKEMLEEASSLIKTFKFPFLEELNKIRLNILNEYPSFNEKYEELLDSGYFLYYDIPAKVCLSEDSLIKYLNVSYTQIKEEIILYYKKKEQIDVVKEAFKTYENICYSASIILLMTIIDSFFYPKFKFNFFSFDPKNNKKREEFLKKYSTDSCKEIINVKDRPLVESIREDEDIKLAKQNHVFNRHLIIHGKIYNYGTKNNFLKLLTLLKSLIMLDKDIKAYENKKK